MRTSDAGYALSKSEIRILRQLQKGKKPLADIEEALALKPAFLSQNLKRLEEKGLIQKTSQGNRKLARFNETKHAMLLRDLLLSSENVDWENVLTGKKIEILFQALSPSGANISGLSETTLWRHLKTLKARGIIIQTDDKNQINPRFSTLTDFLKEYQRYLANKISRTLSENAVILWQEDMQFLIRAPKTAETPSKDFHETATSVYHKYGLPLLSEYDIYLYSTTKKTIEPEDAILHTLLLEPNNVRYTIYALLLFKKTEKQIDKEYLMHEAEKLGLRSRTTGMLQFLRTHIQPQGQVLPTWIEFATKAEEYGVMFE